MLKYFRFIVLFLVFGIFFVIHVNHFAYAEMKPANPDSTTKWDSSPTQSPMLRLFSLQTVSGPIIADISKWQGTIDWKAASNSLDLVIIRTQSGSTYEDPMHKANENGAIQYHVPFGVYAYNMSVSTSDAKVEADDFYNRANKNTLFYVVDVEENTSTSGESMRNIINSYVTELRQKTDKKIGVYIANNLYQSLNIDTSKFDFVWIPRYNNTNTPPNYRYDLWQYTDQGQVNGIPSYVDLNRLNPNVALDLFINKDPVTPSSIANQTPVIPKIADPHYYNSNPQKVVILKNVYQYKSTNFTAAAKKSALTANSIVSVTGISYAPNGTPCLKLANGYYISASKDYVLKVTANIDHYYTAVPGNIVVKSGIYEYRSTNFTNSNKKSGLKKNQIVKITGIAYTSEGTPRLKTSRGTYITANKDYVLKAIATINQYYTTVPGKIIVQKPLYEYKSTNFTNSNRKSALKKNQTVKIADIVYTSDGTPRLKTSKGTYITAQKGYVKSI